ncbi:hypothetical protein AB0J35_43540 [Nonomuraea angiospora]|uniref:hypothetical protein n=1 Tax=Nonomuraea angiospora TaxID=46172 RepID=UPI0034444354
MDLPKSVAALYGLADAGVVARGIEGLFAKAVVDTVAAVEQWAGYGIRESKGRLSLEWHGIAWERDARTGAWEIAGVGAELRVLFSSGPAMG